MIIHVTFRKWQPLYTLIEATVVGLAVGIAWQLAWQETRSLLVNCFGFFFLIQQSLGFMRQMRSWPCQSQKHHIEAANVFATFLGFGLLPSPILLFVIPWSIILLLVYLSTISHIRKFSGGHIIMTNRFPA